MKHPINILPSSEQGYDGRNTAFHDEWPMWPNMILLVPDEPKRIPRKLKKYLKKGLKKHFQQ